MTVTKSKIAKIEAEVERLQGVLDSVLQHCIMLNNENKQLKLQIQRVKEKETLAELEEYITRGEVCKNNIKEDIYELYRACELKDPDSYEDVISDVLDDEDNYEDDNLELI